MYRVTVEKSSNPKLRRTIDGFLGQGEAIQITANGVKEHFLLVTNQRVAITQDKARVWGVNETKMETRSFLLRNITRVEIHAKGNVCSLELILRKKDDTADPSIQLDRCIPSNSLDAKKSVKLAVEIEKKIKQFSTRESTDIPPIANIDQLANILEQALLRAVVKRVAGKTEGTQPPPLGRLLEYLPNTSPPDRNESESTGHKYG